MSWGQGGAALVGSVEHEGQCQCRIAPEDGEGGQALAELREPGGPPHETGRSHLV